MKIDKPKTIRVKKIRIATSTQVIEEITEVLENSNGELIQQIAMIVLTGRTYHMGNLTFHRVSGTR